MRADTIVSLQIYRSCLEFGLHDTEGLFDLPTVMTDPDDLPRIIIQVRADCIETVILCLFCDDRFIQFVTCIFRDLPIFRVWRFLNEPPCVSLGTLVVGCRVLNVCFRPFYLSCPQRLLIDLVL